MSSKHSQRTAHNLRASRGKLKPRRRLSKLGTQPPHRGFSFHQARVYLSIVVVVQQNGIPLKVSCFYCWPSQRHGYCCVSENADTPTTACELAIDDSSWVYSPIIRGKMHQPVTGTQRERIKQQTPINSQSSASEVASLQSRVTHKRERRTKIPRNRQACNQ